MYFNDNKNDTNIDDEFSNKGNLLSAILTFFSKKINRIFLQKNFSECKNTPIFAVKLCAASTHLR